MRKLFFRGLWILVAVFLVISPQVVYAQDAVAVSESREIYDSLEDAGAYVREQMKNKVTTITFSVTEQVADSIETPFEFIYEAVKYSKESGSNGGDALDNEITRYGASWSQYYDHTEYTLTIYYYTTAAQEAELVAGVKAAVAGLKLDGLSDYQKVRKIYTYVCDNVDYDFANLNNASYTLKQTAYAALINKTSVCQGYATLFYRMCIEAGVECRVITGIGNGGGHAWNIVKIGSEWYNVDSTWDGQESETTYNWFLLNEVDFADHTRASSFLTEEFQKQFPMGEDSYKDYSQQAALPDYDNSQVYTYNTVSGKVANNQANGRPKVLIFYRNTCGNSQGTIKSISQNKPDGIDFIAVDIDENTKDVVTQFKNSYGSDSIEFVYSVNEAYSCLNHAFYYHYMFGHTGGAYLPMIVFIDGNNKAQYYYNGMMTADAIATCVDEYCSGAVSWRIVASDTISVGDKLSADIYMKDNRKNRQFFDWSSSDTKVATVDASGNITAVGSGKVVITCKSGGTILATKTITVEVGYTGLKYADGAWRYYNEGAFDAGYTGIVEYNGSLWYVKNGVLDKTYAGLVYSDGWYYVSDGKHNTGYVGFTTYSGSQWYISNGTINRTTGLIYVDGVWYYLTNGKYDTSYKGVTEKNGDTWFIENGTIKKTAKGIWEQNGDIYYIVDGKVDKSVYALKYFNGPWYYFRAGKVDWTYNTLAYVNNAWWYVHNGALDKSYTGLVEFRDQLWYVTEGKLDKEYSGTTVYNGVTYTVSNGIGTAK